MNGSRQQRGANWRGGLQRPNLRPLPDLVWYPQDTVGATVNFTVEEDPSLLRIIGVPQILCSDPLGYPLTVASTGSGFSCDYAAPISQTAIFTLPSLDPAVRNTNGAYLSALRTVLNSPAGGGFIASNLNWAATNTGAGEVTIVFAALPSGPLLMNIPGFLADFIPREPLSWTWDGTLLVLQYGSSVQPGDHIEYFTLAVTTNDATAQVPTANNQTIA